MLSPDDLQQVRSIIQEELKPVCGNIQSVRGDLTTTRDTLTGTVRDVETNLLKAFHSYATGQLARAAGQDAHLTALSARVAALEQRLLELETRPRAQ